jgi:hypothetical protein
LFANWTIIGDLSSTDAVLIAIAEQNNLGAKLLAAAGFMLDGAKELLSNPLLESGKYNDSYPIFQQA